VVAVIINAPQGNRIVLPWCWHIRLLRIHYYHYRQKTVILQQIMEIIVSFFKDYQAEQDSVLYGFVAWLSKVHF